MIFSMTAFARHEWVMPAGSFNLELRSVNHRYLELYLRLPDSLREVEAELRDVLRQMLSRGKIDATLRFEPLSDSKNMVINQSVATQLANLCQELVSVTRQEPNIQAIDFLKWPGVIEQQALLTPEVRKELSLFFQTTVKKLIEAREREGQALKEFLLQRLIQCETQLNLIRQFFPDMVMMQKEKLTQRLAELSAMLDTQRLEQEIAILAQKLDISEEVDRLATHLQEAHRILAEGGQVGRRMDFLLQEMNREANTMSSKAMDVKIQYAVVEIKVLLEQIREQVQNIE